MGKFPEKVITYGGYEHIMRSKKTIRLGVASIANPKVLSILLYLIKNKKTAKQIMLDLSISNMTVYRCLKTLQKSDLIEAVGIKKEGSRKTTVYRSKIKSVEFRLDKGKRLVAVCDVSE